MNIAQLKQDLKDLEEGLDELPEEFKDDVREEIKALKAQIADAEKQESSKDKMKEAAEKKIEKLEESIESPKTPAKVKAAVQKSIASVKKQVKEAVKEDEKERKTKAPKVVVKKAAASKGKVGRPAAKKAAPAKKVVKRKTKAEVKYAKALSNLEKLVNRTKELKAKYKGQGVDLEKDAKRKAKPFGYRLRGNNYRRPTKAEIKSGEAYWEGRPNRADVKRAKFPKLEQGGVMAKGGRTKKRTKASLVADKRYKALKAGRRVSEDGNVYYENRENRSDVNRRLRLADGGMMKKGGRTKKRTKASLVADKRYKALKAGRRVSEDGNVYYENRENRSDVNRRLRLADGGMMKKGGRTPKRSKASLVADKRYKALKAGRRVSEDGNVYYESRANRSDVSRRDRI